MTAMWKKPPLVQAQKRSPAIDMAQQLAELKHKMKLVQDQLRVVRAEKDQIHNSAAYWRQTAEECRKDQDRYQTLREQELMIMGKDGAKYLKGEELDKYIDGELSKHWPAVPVSGSYAQALAMSMMQTKQVVAKGLVENQYHYAWKAYPMSFTITEYADDTNP